MRSKFNTLKRILIILLIMVAIWVIFLWFGREIPDGDIIGKWELVSDADFRYFQITNITPYELHFFSDGTGMEIKGERPPEPFDWKIVMNENYGYKLLWIEPVNADYYGYFGSYVGYRYSVRANSRLFLNQFINDSAPKIPHFSSERDVKRGTRIAFKCLK